MRVLNCLTPLQFVRIIECVSAAELVQNFARHFFPARQQEYHRSITEAAFTAMSDRGERFTWDASQPLGGRHPEQLLRLFSATDVKAMMQKSLNMKTALDTLRKELRNHLGKAVLQKSIEFANQQRMLPPECALALRVYTRNEIYGELNQALREDSGLEEFYHLCICLVKALALLPPHKGSSYRRMNDVEEQVVYFVKFFDCILITSGSSHCRWKINLDLGRIYFDICGSLSNCTIWFLSFPYSRSVWKRYQCIFVLS